jgi:hypothetical protein
VDFVIAWWYIRDFSAGYFVPLQTTGLDDATHYGAACLAAIGIFIKKLRLLEM